MHWLGQQPRHKRRRRQNQLLPADIPAWSVSVLLWVISGLTRLFLYRLLVLLVDRSWEDAPSALWTFIATSFGLTIAAIVEREQLSLFQALQVSNLVW